MQVFKNILGLMMEMQIPKTALFCSIDGIRVMRFLESCMTVHFAQSQVVPRSHIEKTLRKHVPHWNVSASLTGNRDCLQRTHILHETNQETQLTELQMPKARVLDIQ